MRTRWLFRFLHGQRRRRLLLGMAVVSGVLFTGTILVRLSDSGVAQTPPPTPLWPPFTMTYTVQDRDPQTGRLLVDRTVRVVVRDAHAWRAETIRDGVNPKNVGTTRELRDGVMYTYDAEQRVNRQLPLSTKDTVTDIVSPELNPVLLPCVQAGAKPDWQMAPPLVPGRLAIVSAQTTPCPTPRPTAGPCAAAGTTSLTHEQRIEYDPRSLTDRYIGGVAVFGEGRLNGQVIHTFRADSLEFQ